MDNSIASSLKIADDMILNCDLQKIKYDGLFYGKAGLALYCLYMYKLNKEKRYLNKIEEIIEYLFCKNTVENSVLYYQNSFAEGLSGLGYLLLKLRNNEILDNSFNETIDSLSNIIEIDCLKMIKNNKFDFFYGSFGLLYFLLENKKYELCYTYIKQIYNLSLKNNFFLYNNTEDPYTKGYNFGFAHGVIGFISILLKFIDILDHKIMIKDFIFNLLLSMSKFGKNIFVPNNFRSIDDYKTFPSIYPYNIYIDNFTLNTTLNAEIIKNGIVHYTTRIGWCNSDMGHSLLYYKAGVILQNDDFINTSQLIGNFLIKRIDFNVTGIDSMYMCHGSSGVAQMYKRLYELTHNENYFESYLYWLEKTSNYLIMEIKKEEFKPTLISGWLVPILLLNEFVHKIDIRWDDTFLLT